MYEALEILVRAVKVDPNYAYAKAQDKARFERLQER